MFVSRTTSFSDTTSVTASNGAVRVLAVEVDVDPAVNMSGVVQLFNGGGAVPGTDLPVACIFVPLVGAGTARRVERVKAEFQNMIFGNACNVFFGVSATSGTAVTMSNMSVRVAMVPA